MASKECNLIRQIRSRKRIRDAWKVVKKNGLASTNSDTRIRIREFDSNSEFYKDRIYRSLLKDRFRFHPSRGVTIKRKGKLPRPIVISEFEDRIVQRSLLTVLQEQPALKNFVTNDHSFGGIASRDVRCAISELCSIVKNGAKFYLKSDIKDFFSNIPRKKAIEIIADCLGSNSLTSILDAATSVELENLAQLKSEYQDLFPTYEIGVAQGCCLSPLLGNVLLSNFDREMNSGGLRCLRYVDDFIILGNSERDVWTAFRKGIGILKKFSLTVYHPNTDTLKACTGITSRAIDYLGCRVSPSFVQPSKEAKSRLMAKLQSTVYKSLTYLKSVQTIESPNYEHSLAGSFYNIHQTIRAWGNHYSFCNADLLWKHIDKRIDGLLMKYIGTYSSIRANLSNQNSRRALGIHLLSDSKSSPILPL